MFLLSQLGLEISDLCNYWLNSFGGRDIIIVMIGSIAAISAIWWAILFSKDTSRGPYKCYSFDMSIY